jgi:murein DD-endopeptidase MepM/ murein hydrolase activator NlpD
VKRSLIVGFIVFTLVFSLASHESSFANTDSSSIEQKKADIKERDKKILQLEKRKKLAEQDQTAILNQIKQTENQLNHLDMEVYNLEQKAKSGQEQIKQLENQVNLRQKVLNNRLRMIYVQGNLFYLQLLLESSSFGDFLKRYDLIAMVNRADQQVIHSYQEKRQELYAAQKQMETTLTNLNQQQEKAKQLYEDLKTQYQQHQDLIAKLDQNMNVLEDENTKSRQELNQLLAKDEQNAVYRERKGQLAVSSMADRYTGGKLMWPVDGGVVTSPFGMRFNPIEHTYRMHEGIDIGAPMGTPIRAAAAGEVIEARPSNGYGYIVVIYHGNGLATLYAHMYAQTVKVHQGQTVARGQEIAEVGSNGNSTGPHLHFEVHLNGSPVNPMPYLR